MLYNNQTLQPVLLAYQLILYLPRSSENNSVNNKHKELCDRLALLTAAGGQPCLAGTSLADGAFVNTASSLFPWNQRCFFICFI